MCIRDSSNLKPYGGTFLIFSDYCKPAIRLAALMKIGVIFVLSHDSIGLGEDGPTHQPVEQLSGLRSIPNLNVFRPADTTEVAECWQIALQNNQTPSVIALTRQRVSPIRKQFTEQNYCESGAYEIMRTGNDIKCTILASGSEVGLAIEVGHKLATRNIYSKVISVPCLDIFEKNSEETKSKILDETNIIFSIEAAKTDSWGKYVGKKGKSFGVDDFGKSAPYKEIFNDFNLKADEIKIGISTFLSGGGGLVSTTDDYQRFVTMLMNGGELEGKRVIGRKTLEFMTSNHLPNQTTLNDFGQSTFSETAMEGM